MKETLSKSITVLQSLTTKIVNLNPIVNQNSLSESDIIQLNNKITNLENKFKSFVTLTFNVSAPNGGGSIIINNNNYSAHADNKLHDNNYEVVQSLVLSYPLTIQYQINSTSDYAYLKDKNGNIINGTNKTIILQSGPTELVFYYYKHGSGGAD